ncbi:MAG: spore cortex biosynthesis protein YabQ [Oscillospiraceae bacterium]
MENYVTAQLAALCKAVLLGWLSGCVYDLLRSVRLLRRRSRALTHTLDALYGAALLLALLGFALHVGGGQLRLYMLLGAAAGCALYFWAFRGIFRPLWGFWTGAAASMAALLARPARFALKTAKKIGRFLKKHFHFLAQMRYNETVSVEVSPHATQQRRREGEKCPCKRKRRPASAVILPAFWSF